MHEILNFIGNYGRYQIFIFSLIIMPAMISSALIMLNVFTATVSNVRYVNFNTHILRLEYFIEIIKYFNKN